MRLRLTDGIGVGLFLALAGWILVASVIAGTDATRWVQLVLAVGAVALLSRLVTEMHSWIVPALVTVAAVLVAWTGRDVLGANLDSPIGYANATAAFFAIAAGAALLVAVRAPEGWIRIVATATAVGLAAVPWANGSLAGVIVTMLLPLALIGGFGRSARRVLLISGALLVVLVFAMTVWFGGSRSLPGGQLGDALTMRRVHLWADALQFVANQPLTGIGPGSFEFLSPTAQSDADALWAHSEYLEVGAATGLPGMLLALGLVIWGFVWLWDGPGRLGASVAAVTLTGAAMHAAVDYVFHFPAVPVALAAVVGAGAAAGPRTSRRSSRSLGC